MNRFALENYIADQNLLHLASGRTEQYTREAADWNKETFQIREFLQTLSGIKREDPVMIELGTSLFPTYSKAFADVFPNGTNICTEILKESYEKAKQIVPEAVWYHAFNGVPMHLQENVPTPEETGGARYKSIKSIVEENNLTHIDIFHMDVQGSEVSVLEELKEYKHLVHHMFISLHDTYQKCMNILRDWNCYYRFAHPKEGAYGDGLIICYLKDNVNADSYTYGGTGNKVFG